jgi:hypothetical protein
LHLVSRAFFSNIHVTGLKFNKDFFEYDFPFTFNVYHMADKDESDLVMVSNESETDSNPRKWHGTLLTLKRLLFMFGFEYYFYLHLVS